MRTPSTPSRSLLARPAAIAAGVALLVGAAGVGTRARADTIDPSMPRVVVVGPPRGEAPSERLDPHRTGRSRSRLPATPVELWRRHVSGTIDVPPLVDADGNVLVALTNPPELVKLAPDAHELWRARLGVAGAALAPTLLGDGTIAVIAATGTAWGFTPGGVVRFSTPLGIARRDADTIPLALADGGLLVAAGNVVIELDADGIVRARGALEDRSLMAPMALTAAGAAGGTERAVGAVVDSPGGPLVTTATGGVYRFRPPAAPRKIGSFGGTPSRGAMLADDRTLVAVVDGRRVVALDLPTGTTHVRAGGVLFDAPPVLGPGGLLLVTTQLGMLVGLDALGNEKLHLMLDKIAPPGVGVGVGGTFLGGAGGGELKPSPSLVIDPGGRVAFLRANGRVGVVTLAEAPGHVEIAAEKVCPGPVSLVPAGEKRMLIACRDGGLWMYGE